MNTASAATSTTAVAPGKSHYVVLDGLRGVAALMVFMFHTFEAYANNDPTRQIINHGYLAVDFFFLLSGFVIAYAYDDRWDRMTQWEFYKRRLIRLQPMVVLGSVIGAALFYYQAGTPFPEDWRYARLADAAPSCCWDARFFRFPKRSIFVAGMKSIR